MMDRLDYYVAIFLLISLECCLCFHVNFREHSNVQVEPFNTQIFKREMSQFFDKASYSFNGFERVASVPVLFPLDICLMDLNGIKYATTLHINKDGVRHFSVFKMMNGTYEIMADYPTPRATAMDCHENAEKGYIAIAYNITEPVDDAREGSPVFEIANDRLRAVQFFPTPHISEIFLHNTGNDLFMLQSFKLPNEESSVASSTSSNPSSKPSSSSTSPSKPTSTSTPSSHSSSSSSAATLLKCPFYKWSGTTFNKVGRIPCTNARHLEPFSIDYENYVAVANYADQRGRTQTNSEIYKYDREKKKFNLLQKIKTNGAVDVKYFSVPSDDARRQHFLIFGNSISSRNTPAKLEKAKREGRNLEADSVFYIFEKGQFVPYQKLSFYDVEQFLPVQSSDSEKFLLLVACNNQDIKIFNLNDWKFEESEIQFTQGALGKGVSNMRIFQENDNSYLVIANELMSDNETNIFLPIFKQDEHANSLRQQIIEWAKTNIERLSSIDVDGLKQAVEKKLEHHDANRSPIVVTEIPTSNVHNVITKSLVYPRLKFSANYWKALSYAKQALDALETQLKQRSTKVRQRRETPAGQDTGEPKDSNNYEYEFDRLKIGTLIVKDRMKARRVNGYDVKQPMFDRVAAKKVIVTGKYEKVANATSPSSPDQERDQQESIQVDNLKIAGKLNEYTWDHLWNNSLRRSGLQFLKAPVNVKSLRVDKITIANGEMSGQQLNKLVSIDNGSYVVNQGVQFAKPITAKNLVIHERLNNIHIYKNQFDVLLKNSNRTQVIEGPKTFDNLKVLEPITLAGQVKGDHLLAMSPNKAVHESITLTGDFTISGDVTITKLLNTDDIIDVRTRMSSKIVLSNGLRMDRPLEDVNVKFEQPIEVNNSMLSFVNAQDLQQLIKTHTNEVQVIEGEKVFRGNLVIEKGFSEVKTINGIDVEGLEKRLLLRNGNQTINVPMHLGKIVVKSVNSPHLTLNSVNLTDYLTKSGSQKIHRSLKVDKLRVKNLHLEDLHTNGKIFDEELAKIYQQKAKNAPHTDIFQKNRKFHGSIYVRNLKLNSTINGKTIEQLEQQLTQLDGNIKYVGDLKFNYDMQISNLTFAGKFNGIAAGEFGKCWLQKIGDQNFTAPQTLASVQCDRGVVLEGTLNGYTMEDFTMNTYWINRNEHIPRAIFENPIQLQGALVSQTVNGLQLPQDILFRSSAKPQILTQNLTINRDLTINGKILNTTTINGFDLSNFETYLEGHGSDTLYVEHGNFIEPPTFRTLNRHNLKETLDAVWLANENVDLKQHVEIADGLFEGLLEFEGPINNMNLKYLKENYFSLSKPQDISTEMVFSNEIKFDGDFHADEIHLFGPIVESNSTQSFNFNEFVAHTLKTSGPHKITGNWTLIEGIIQGPLRNVLVNQVSLVDDVVRLDLPVNEITAPKIIHSAVIAKLYATPTSLVNGVNVSAWIRDTVFVYENYTIYGTTTLDIVNMYNDLRVDGPVNNVTFDENTLLLRDREQVIHGNVRIRNKFPAQQRILANNFENLRVETINGKNIEEFYANRAKMAPDMSVEGNLIFNHPLRLEEYRGNDVTVFGDMKWKRGTRNDGNITSGRWETLQTAAEMLHRSYANPSYILEDLEIRQTLRIPTKRIFSLSLRLKGEFIDIIGVFNESLEFPLQFYSWDVGMQQFIFNKNLSWLPQEKSHLDIFGVAFRSADFLIVENLHDGTFQQSIISNETEGLQEMLNLKNHYNGKIEGFEMDDEDCFAIYSNCSDVVPMYCLELANSKLAIVQKASIPRAQVKQVLALAPNLIALLTTDGVEIWNTSSILEPVERIAVVHPVQLAVGFKNNAIYLAVISEIKVNSLHHGAVEVYRSVTNSSFEHMQTINCVNPLQLEFSNIPQSDDLLLYILTESYDRPLIVHQYKGLAGFEQIVATSTLPIAVSMHTISLKSTKQHLIALFGGDEITFVEVMLKS